MAMPDFCLTSCGIVAVVGRCRRWRCGRRTRTFSSQSTTRQWKRGAEQFQLALGVSGLRHELRQFSTLACLARLWTGLDPPPHAIDGDDPDKSDTSHFITLLQLIVEMTICNFGRP
jgi:hypothetical protein